MAIKKLITPEQIERAEILLQAMNELLDKCRDSCYVEDIFMQTAVWDGAECDGGCWHEEVKTLLEIEE